MAGIRFHDYVVVKASYEKNLNFDESTQNLDVDMQFSCEIIEQDEQAIVNLYANCSDITKNDSPFTVEVKIAGFFESIEQENEGIEFENYLTSNAIAILFPYLRSIVAELTMKSNEFPALQLPVMNIAQLIAEQDGIVYKRVH